MKSKLIGLVILLVVILAAGGYMLFTSGNAVTELNGYLGGEKIGLYEDEEIQKILKDEYALALNYKKAGSLDMITADHTGMDYLFPSSQTALDLYKKQLGSPLKSEIIFNTPIVLYSYDIVAEALEEEGLLTVTDGVYYMDMQQLAEYIIDGKSWSDVGLDALYGDITVSTTDPTKSNSGLMFSGLMANVLNGGDVVGMDSVDTVLPELVLLFQKLGYMETSSADLFEQYLKTGVGAKPLIAGYESQLLEFAVENPEDWQEIRDDVVIIYPVPTVWSTHTYIALNEAGELGIDALLDEEIQRLAWEKHGFRTGVYSAASDISIFGVDGIAQDVTKIIHVPDSDVMAEIVDALT